MRIAPLRDDDLDSMGRPLLGQGRQEDERADDDDDDDDDWHKHPRHGAAFAERGSRCIAP